MKLEPVRLGIIGAGGAVRRLHLPVLRQTTEEFRIVGVAGRSRGNAEEVAREAGGAAIYPNHDALLADSRIEAVLVAVPIIENARIILDALRSGKHVLAEKPIAATAEQAREVVRAGAGCGDRILEIGENFRYRADILEAARIVREGRIGEVFAFQVHVQFDFDDEKRQVWTGRSWRRQPEHAGGFLLDSGVHSVCGVREILGEIVQVYAQTLDRHPTIGGPDTLLMQLTLAGGAIGHYFSTYTARDDHETVFDLVAFGSRGTLRLTEGKVIWNRERGTDQRVHEPEDYDRGYPGQWANFYGAIRRGEAVISTAHKALVDLLVIDAALRSAAGGRSELLQANEIREDRPPTAPGRP